MPKSSALEELNGTPGETVLLDDLCLEGQALVVPLQCRANCWTLPDEKLYDSVTPQSRSCITQSNVI